MRSPPANVTCGAAIAGHSNHTKCPRPAPITIEQEMRAWLIDELTGLERLRLSEVPAPVPQPGEALLELHFAALNPADRYLAERQYPAKPKLPHILGRDGMGVVRQ